MSKRYSGKSFKDSTAKKNQDSHLKKKERLKKPKQKN